MKTKISIFITLISLLFGATATFAQGTQAYFKKDGVTVFQTPISDIDSIVFKQTTKEEEGVVINGVRWATRNVGAHGTFVQNPEDYGEYYQFNKGTTDFLFDNDYNNSVYANSDSWLPANDPSPTGWRIPRLDEIQKLFDADNVTWGWIDNNGITGNKFTDKATGNFIFLPAAGFRYNFDGALYLAGFDGYYWSSMVLDAYNAYGLYFGYGDANWWNDGGRCYGFSVRPVAE